MEHEAGDAVGPRGFAPAETLRNSDHVIWADLCQPVVRTQSATQKHMLPLFHLSPGTSCCRLADMHFQRGMKALVSQRCGQAAVKDPMSRKCIILSVMMRIKNQDPGQDGGVSLTRLLNIAFALWSSPGFVFEDSCLTDFTLSTSLSNSVAWTGFFSSPACLFAQQCSREEYLLSGPLPAKDS